MTIKVLVNGAFGKMGRVTQEAIRQQNDLLLVGALGREDNLSQTIKETRADIVVDFTLPQTVFSNAQVIIQSGARPVIGTTGLTPQQIDELKKQCQQKKIGGIIAPNFSLGAILMMRYAQDAAKYFNHAEIIEMHHDKKVDAPSGTALKTAEMMAKENKPFLAPHTDLSARGENHKNIQIHSVRLPGLFAHQMVILGGIGETLTIRHDSNDRNAMMPGVCLACRKAMTLNDLIYGLENII
ncbi:MAG: 4-hydroxy-tetrahydrodipicolinate reductase [Coxiella sp. RIFCSPHIGHO2_12_FULL_42_15]|nr:MAG: 4-hydroxy-tetrahydrodipicolinate reductase [Coxiella sp. RIFCSPHIGHO2_12_FULL_42_15]